jgi:hypothetical protein
MAKPKAQTAEDLVNEQIAQGEGPVTGTDEVAGVTESQAEAIKRIKALRAKAREATGGEGPRVIRDYQDAERLFNLGMLSPEEIVDCEERKLFSPQILAKLNGTAE